MSLKDLRQMRQMRGKTWEQRQDELMRRGWARRDRARNKRKAVSA